MMLRACLLCIFRTQPLSTKVIEECIFCDDDVRAPFLACLQALGPDTGARSRGALTTVCLLRDMLSCLHTGFASNSVNLACTRDSSTGSWRAKAHTWADSMLEFKCKWRSYEECKVAHD